MKLLKVLAIGLTVGGVALATDYEKVDAAEWTPRTVEQIKADMKGNEYTIVWGDTLSGISQATNISVQKLADMNKIANVDLIYAGNKLVFEGNFATVQNSAGETVSQTVIQDTDKVNPTQPVGQPAVSQDTTSNATNSADQSVAPTTPAGDSGANTPEQPVQPSTPSDNGNQGGTVTPTPDQNQGGNNNNGNNNGGNEGGDVTPPQPVEKWTVWYSASDEANAAHNIEKGTKVFDTEAEATAWIDQYADGLLAQGITSNSYGVSSFLVQ
ncbi:LysM peptidoglycan-binding domain-containing protein [Enterococcus durans]|uniref:LysM peptidoglycan-binding domain-containing protein n=1 Tax=Enterococcus durans TaxID=53345 RepID=UPI00143108D5|nr:LysM domain-containing protein [Enterococcus durans]NJE65052.1 LysM peptidoglycan-binding domain-containing protein [Enterococcus durans]